MKHKATYNQINTTPRQLQILQTISNFRANHCCSPTIAELAKDMGTSRSTVFEHIAELRKKRLLTTSPNKARSLKITSKAQKLLNQLAFEADTYPESTPDGIPLVGRVAAGMPIDAIETHDQLSISSHFCADENTFALEVSGDSMIEDNIHDGDFVVCRKSATANNGQLVVAIVDDNSATVKRFYREKNKIRLQPANENYSPIYTQNCRIEGIVLGLVRKL